MNMEELNMNDKNIIMGIYQIKNLVNGKFYIGSSKDINKRFSQHKNMLNKNSHHSIALQRAWNKYGAINFDFLILEIVTDIDTLLEREQEWLDKTECYKSINGYNISKITKGIDVDYNKYNKNRYLYIRKDNIYSITEMKLDATDKLVYYILRDCIDKQNCVTINGVIPSFVELEPILSLSDRTIRKSLKILEENNLIKLVQSGHRKAIYINPEYCSYSLEVADELLEMFNII